LVSESRPEIMLAKWDEEVAMTVTYDNLKARGQRDLLTNTVKWKGNQEEVHAYPLEPAFGMEDGGFEIEIELLEPPQKNVFDFRIAGAEDLDFFYQPPLTEEYIAGETCIDIVCTNATTGEITRMRPENAVGSYAVYHKNKKDHIRGKKNYGTGKVMHIYRPLVIDANGNSVWGSLSYQNGKLSVTVPPEFLAIATYPVIVDPTFGYTTAGTAGTNTIKNTMVFAYASSTSDGTLDSISYYEGAVAGTKYSKLALYSSNSATDVNALIATTSEITVLNTDDNTLQTATFPATGPSITAGTNYFFAVVGSAAIGAHTIAYDNGTLSVASTLVNTYTNSP
ncbi:MAG: hypothetical protein COX82_04200, partial [Candidatus Magasanikbacteria bacterium CG_4_10_14_0_2_um_filter_41_10]